MIGNRIDDMFRDYAIEKYGKEIVSKIKEEDIEAARIWAFESFGEMVRMYMAAGLSGVENDYSLKEFFFMYIEGLRYFGEIVA